MIKSSREEHLYMAKITEQIGIFSEMQTAMTAVVNDNPQLNVEERNLLSVAYKNQIGSRRAAWRSLAQIEKKEEQKDSKNLHLLREYKSSIEIEMNEICKDILELINNKLIPSAKSPEQSIFFNKMKGDFYRYMFEYTKGDQNNKAYQAYQCARSIVQKQLNPADPTRLGLALSYSVFTYQIKNDVKEAYRFAKKLLMMQLPSQTKPRRINIETPSPFCNFFETI